MKKKKSVDDCTEMIAIGEELRTEIVGFIESYLERKEMELITGNHTSGTTRDNEGHVTIIFYFRQKDQRSKPRRRDT